MSESTGRSTPAAYVLEIEGETSIVKGNDPTKDRKRLVCTAFVDEEPWRLVETEEEEASDAHEESLRTKHGQSKTTAGWLA